MKRFMQLYMAVTAIVIGNMAHAYTFTFTNSLKGPVSIRVKLGVFEPWYYGIAQGNGMKYTFDFGVNKQANLNLQGTQKEYTGRKVGFCLSEVNIAPYTFVNNQWQQTDEWYQCPFYQVSSDKNIVPYSGGLCGNYSFHIQAEGARYRAVINP